jgi:ABC-type Fe3+-citrate transport system substrate-binding protein
MKMMKTFLWSILLISAVAFIGCSKDDDSKD